MVCLRTPGNSPPGRPLCPLLLRAGANQCKTLKGDTRVQPLEIGCPGDVFAFWSSGLAQWALEHLEGSRETQESPLATALGSEHLPSTLDSLTVLAKYQCPSDSIPLGLSSPDIVPQHSFTSSQLFTNDFLRGTGFTAVQAPEKVWVILDPPLSPHPTWALSQWTTPRSPEVPTSIKYASTCFL